MLKKKIDVVIFDFDGVLSSDYFYSTLEFINKDIFEKINRTIFQGERDMIRSWMRGHIAYQDVNSIIASRLGVDKELLDRELIKGINAMILNAHLLNFIQELRTAGVKTALMTDNMDVFEEYLVPIFRLRDYFDEIISSSANKRLKKDDNWKTVHDTLARLHCNFSNALFIDDWDEIGSYIKSQNGNFYLYPRGNKEIDFGGFKKWFDDNFYIKSAE